MDTTIKQSQLSIASRVRRVAFGSLFIGVAMTSSGQLGYLAIVPLVAIYPILTGLFGEDPIDGFLANWEGGFEGLCFRPSTRIALLALGVGAIGVLMMSPEDVGIRALLALASVYPITAGLFGEDLFSLMLGHGRKKQQVKVPSLRQPANVVRRRQRVVVRHRAAAIHHSWFGHGAGPRAA